MFYFHCRMPIAKEVLPCTLQSTKPQCSTNDYGKWQWQCGKAEMLVSKVGMWSVQDNGSCWMQPPRVVLQALGCCSHLRSSVYTWQQGSEEHCCKLLHAATAGNKYNVDGSGPIQNIKVLQNFWFLPFMWRL